jgi:hypothetical protein
MDSPAILCFYRRKPQAVRADVRPDQAGCEFSCSQPLFRPVSPPCPVNANDRLDTGPMLLEFEGEIFYWRGPAPFLFVAVPEEPSGALKAISASVTYGWGVIPVHARIGQTEWQTSLFPKQGRYLVPIQGNRISTFEDSKQIVIIPSCLESFGMNATFGGFFIFEQIERHVAKNC